MASKLIFLIVALACVFFNNIESNTNANLKFSYKSCGEDSDPGSLILFFLKIFI